MAYTCSKSLMAQEFLRQGGFAKINLHSKVHNLETRRHFMYARGPICLDYFSAVEHVRISKNKSFFLTP